MNILKSFDTLGIARHVGFSELTYELILTAPLASSPLSVCVRTTEKEERKEKSVTNCQPCDQVHLDSDVGKS